MRDVRGRQRSQGDDSGPSSRAGTPGTQTLTSRLDVQRLAAPDAGQPLRVDDSASSPGRPGDVQQLAEGGVTGAGGPLPHRHTIQSLFGRHDLTHIAAHTDERARDASTAIGAEAYATGDHVAFATASPSLHTAAHEAAHVVQQRGGVQLSGGVGAAGDPYERHADQVADLVVQGRSAEHVLDDVAGTGPATARGAGAPVQRLVAIDGLNASKGVVKLIAQYNDALRATVSGSRPAAIQGAAVQKLVAQLNRINGALVGPVTGLLPAQQASLRAQVQAELTAVRAALARPADLARLVSATSVAGQVGGGVASTAAAAGEGVGQAEIGESSTMGAGGSDAAESSTADVGQVEVGASSTTGAEGIDAAESSTTDVGQEVGASSTAGAGEVEGAESSAAGAAAPLAVRTRREGETRIGFEIEPGGHYSGAAALSPIAGPFINQTLLTFTTPDQRILLEMLLDDPRVDQGRAIFQVEFRTPPLPIASINQETATAIRGAISGLIASDVFFAGRALGTGWARSAPCGALIQAIGARRLTTTGRFRAPPDLAQHVTSSINLGAYPRLPRKHQQALYAKGAGSTTKVELYRLILAALGSGTINASTRGRNDAAVTVKSSIESMLAAEQALQVDGADDVSQAMTTATRPTTASVGRNPGDQYAIPPDLDQSVAGIQASGTYPAIQGEGSSGYLAVAEKLQPPLFDPRNRELRVLVEHRTDELRAAVNEVLAGRPSRVWDDFVRAASAMDRER